MMVAGVGADDDMGLLRSSARAMSMQRSVLDVAARNVAAAQASTPDHPYSRLVAQFGADDDGASGAFDPADDDGSDRDAAAVVGYRSEPGTGDALTEMVAVLDAQRAYEQNASIFDTAKRLAERTIDIGRS
jgi:flagellar basal body rod protein FlgC